MCKAAFTGDALYRQPEFFSANYKPLKISNFKGRSHLHFMITATTTADLEVKAVFLSLLGRTKVKRQEDLDLSANPNWTRKTALEEVERAVGSKDMEDHWISKLESLKNQRKSKIDPGKELEGRTKQIKANLTIWNELREKSLSSRYRDKRVRLMHATVKRQFIDEARRDFNVQYLQKWDEFRERRKIIMETL